MGSTQKKDKDSISTDPQTLITVSSVVYALMAVVGMVIIAFSSASENSSLFQLPASSQEQLRLGVFTLLGSAVLIVLGLYFELHFKSFKATKKELGKIFSQCTIPTGLYLAAISSIGEEILFRGAILPFTGIFGSAIIFGLLHFGPSMRLTSWTLWAILAGILLGWMFDTSGTLWVPILCHFLVNSFSIMRLRVNYLQQEEKRCRLDENK